MEIFHHIKWWVAVSGVNKSNVKLDPFISDKYIM